MSIPVASKNLYEALGNDPEQDSDYEAPPTKVAEGKTLGRSGKRATGGDVAPKSGQRGEGAARGGRDNYTGSERAYRDRNAGSTNNRERPTDDGVRQDRPRRDDTGSKQTRGSRGGSAGYGARGLRGARTTRDDRHSRSNVGDHEKQAAHGWGGTTGEDELVAETGGEADARAEEKEGVIQDDVPVDENGVPVDQQAPEEDKTKSYEQYLAEQLEKKAALNDRPLAARQANEGSSKKFPEGKAIAKNEESEDFFVGSGGKNKRTRERKEKNVVDIDQTWKESEAPSTRGGSRGGRGRGEGGRGRGEGGRGGRGGERGDRGDRGERGDRGGRGGFRGEGRGSFRGEGRGSFRGSRGGAGQGGPNITDSSAFPSLGA